MMARLTSRRVPAAMRRRMRKRERAWAKSLVVDKKGRLVVDGVTVPTMVGVDFEVRHIVGEDAPLARVTLDLWAERVHIEPVRGCAVKQTWERE